MKSFGLSSIAVALFMSAGLASEAALAQTTMRLSHVLAKNSHYGDAVDAFAKEIEKRTNGRYKIETFHAAALGGEREGLEALQLGTQELAFTGVSVSTNFVPELKILDVPYLFRDTAHVRSVMDGPIGQEFLKKFEAKGIKGLAWGDNGFRHMTNNKRPVHGPEDLKGLKLRTQENPVHVKAYRAFGVQPTPMAFAELFTALQQGTVDGQENPLAVITSSKFYQVQKHLSLTGHVYSITGFLMSKPIYDKLSEADKKAFLEAAKEAVKVNRQRLDNDDRDAVTFLRSNGMQVVESVDRAKFQAALAPLNSDFEKQFGKANLDAIRNAK
ncbi:MAG: dctP [Herminiimonas sp.]|nr:dctP [Herminiimonas sp.]